MRLIHQVPLYCISLFVAARKGHKLLWAFLSIFAFNSVSQVLLIQGLLSFFFWKLSMDHLIQHSYKIQIHKKKPSNEAKLWTFTQLPLSRVFWEYYFIYFYVSFALRLLRKKLQLCLTDVQWTSSTVKDCETPLNGI